MSCIESEYLGLVPFSYALNLQEKVSQKIIGFESQSVVTLGKRGELSDLLVSEQDLRRRGFTIEKVDRGGQATIHNPGQLVIFPVVEMGELGIKAWVCLLTKVTQALALEMGISLQWDAVAPGLYSAQGKVASVGVRVRDGVSRHGIAINVTNDLSDFSAIRVCGSDSQKMDRLGGGGSLSDIFKRWVEIFNQEFSAKS